MKQADMDWTSYISNLYGTSTFLSVNRMTLEEIGPNETIMLMLFIGKYNYLEARDKLDEDGDFFYGNVYLQKESGLTKTTMSATRDKLIERGFISYKLKGAPSKNFYRIHFNCIGEWLSRILSDGQMSGILTASCQTSRRHNKLIEKEKIEEDTTSARDEDLDKEEEELDRKKASQRKSTIALNKKLEEARVYYNEIAAQYNGTPCLKLTTNTKGKAGRRSLMRDRIKEAGGLEEWKKVMDTIHTSPFLTGKTDSPDHDKFRLSVEFILQVSTFTRLREGFYHKEVSSGPSMSDKVKSGNKGGPRRTKPKRFHTDSGKRMSPRSLADKFYNGQSVVVRHFISNPYRQAKALCKIGKDPSQCLELTESLLELVEYIQNEQERYFDDHLREVMPGPTDVLDSYIEWIQEQEWLDNRNLTLFLGGGKIFQRFRADESKNDNMGRDPLTGTR